MPEGDLEDYSVHSFRIYVACALLAAKAPCGEACGPSLVVSATSENKATCILDTTQTI